MKTAEHKNNWIAWPGGFRPPLMPSGRVDVELRDGAIATNVAVDSISWHHYSGPHDVMFYKPRGADDAEPIEPSPAPDAPAEDDYESLRAILMRAYLQASQGKGAERHADSRPFTSQPMLEISRLLGSAKGCQFQAMKKIQESTRMEPGAAVRELLGAVNYLAGAIIYIEEEADAKQK